MVRKLLKTDYKNFIVFCHFLMLILRKLYYEYFWREGCIVFIISVFFSLFSILSVYFTLFFLSECIYIYIYIYIIHQSLFFILKASSITCCQDFSFTSCPSNQLSHMSYIFFFLLHWFLCQFTCLTFWLQLQTNISNKKLKKQKSILTRLP